MGKTIGSTWTGRFLIAAWAFGSAAPGVAVEAKTAPTTQPAVASPQPASAAAPTSAPSVEEQVEIKPRFELYVPSLERLASEALRSRSGALAEHVGTMVMEIGSVSSEGVDMEGAALLFRQIRGWPDTAIDVVTFAADTEGQPRWAVRFDWPLDGLRARLQPLLSLEAAEMLLEGVHLTSRPDGGYAITLPQTTLAYLLPAGDGRSLLSSHADTKFPASPFRGTEETKKNGDPLLVCRLNLKSTEKDSGATFWSSLSAITDVVYDARVNEEGDWVEQIRVHWPPGIGLLAKAAAGKVKQTFFVPDEAYASAVFSVVGVQGMLESTAGFGPQMVVNDSGGFTMVGETGPGPIAAHTDSQVCFTILPGTGFMPVPDIVFQVKTKRAEKMIEGIREASTQINKLRREREQAELWYEAEVKDRPVFWSDGSGMRGGMMMPFLMRPVLFVTEEVDARGRDREFLVLGLTSTSPKRFVRRWVEMPRAKDRRYLPAKKKTHGQLWINWQQTYRWLQPYANVALNTVSGDLFLPRVKDMVDKLTDALLTAKVRYDGLSVVHRGPIPSGLVAIPVMFAIATRESSGTDLARERAACRTLKVLYHHAELFKQDMGRWPAELAELDGYIDFAGHPYLLKLDLSSKKERSDWLEELFESSDDEEDEEDGEEEDDALVNLDDDSFVVDWGRDSWSLSVAPGTFEHLEKLSIDQNGDIHREEKEPSREPDDREAAD